MARKSTDPNEVLDLVDNCPPEFVVGEHVGRGPGQGLVFPYRNFDLDFRKVYRVQAENAANDINFPHLRMADKPVKEEKKKETEAKA